MKKRIYFIGTPEIAVPTLEKISTLENYELVAVGVFPDKKVGRKQILTPCPVKERAETLELPIREIGSKKELQESFEEIKFDLALVIAFGMIFPKEIFEARDQKEWDIINVHFSLLPDLRGASPVQSAILTNQKESGITFQSMVFELDAGDVLLREKYDIQNKNTAELWSFFAAETANIIESFLDHYFKFDLTKISQEELIKQGETVSKCGMFTKTDGLVDPKNETAQEIERKFRALNVWPGIYLEHEVYKTIKLIDLSLDKDSSKLKIDCKNGTHLAIKKLQISGKKPISGNDFFNGHGHFQWTEEKERQEKRLKH